MKGKMLLLGMQRTVEIWQREMKEMAFLLLEIWPSLMRMDTIISLVGKRGF